MMFLQIVACFTALAVLVYGANGVLGSLLFIRGGEKGFVSVMLFWVAVCILSMSFIVWMPVVMVTGG